MKKFFSLVTTSALLIILSLSFSLIPVEQTEVIIPNEEKDIIYNVFTNIVELDSNFIVPVNINVSKIQDGNQSLVPILTNFVFEDSLRVQFNSSGLYLFQIVSPELIQLTFRDIGMRNGIIISFGIFVVAKVGIWLLTSNIIFINPENLT